MVLNFFKSAQSIRPDSIQRKYLTRMSGIDIKESTEINVLACNYDGAGNAIVEEFKYKAKEGIFGKAEYSRVVKIISASELKAIIENPEYTLGSAE